MQYSINRNTGKCKTPLNVIHTFKCIEKKKKFAVDKYNYLEEGYQLQNGECIVGIDALRELDKIDCASYPVVHFSSIYEVQEIYDCNMII